MWFRPYEFPPPPVSDQGSGQRDGLRDELYYAFDHVTHFCLISESYKLKFNQFRKLNIDWIPQT